MYSVQSYKGRSRKCNVRLISLGVALGLVVALIAGCSSISKKESSSPSPQPEQQKPAQQDSQPAASTEKPSLNLKLASHMPASYSNQQVAEKWAKAVEEETNGRIKITSFPSESLVAAKDLFDSVSTGRTEMAILPESYVSTAIPILGFWEIPFLFNGTQAVKKTLDSGLRDLFREAYLERNVVALDWNFFSWVTLGTVKKELKKPEDLKGMRVRVPGAITQAVTEKLGGAVVWLSSGDIYMALQRNTIDVMWNTVDSMEKRKLYEVAKYLVDEPIWTTGATLSINKVVWAKIAPEDRAVMEDLAHKIYHEEQIAELDRIDRQSVAVVKEKGVNIIKWTPEEREVWKNAMQPTAIDSFLSKVGDRGKIAIELAKQYGK